MKLLVLGMAMLFFLPSATFAANFAKQSLFLSKSPVTEGETVLIHTVVANKTATKFTGDVVFKDGEAMIGSVAVTIAPGGANTVSVSWKPSAGTHTVTAELTGGGNAVEKQSATFTIAEKQKPEEAAPTSPAQVASSEEIQKSIENFYPAAASFTKPLFDAVDFGRTKAAQALDQGIAWAKEKSKGTSGKVLGEETPDPGSNLIGTATKALSTAAVPVLSFLRYLIESPGLFYPIFAILFFYILWRIFKRMRRRDYSSA